MSCAGAPSYQKVGNFVFMGGASEFTPGSSGDGIFSGIRIWGRIFGQISGSNIHNGTILLPEYFNPKITTQSNTILRPVYPNTIAGLSPGKQIFYFLNRKFVLPFVLNAKVTSWFLFPESKELDYSDDLQRVVREVERPN